MSDWKLGERAKMQALAAHRPVITHQVFENHMLTEGLRDAALEGEVQATTHVELLVNQTLLIGGLSRVKELVAEQRAAAAMYRGLWDAAQLGGARAIDYSQPIVDVSGKAANPADGGVDARRRYADVTQALGKWRSSLIENVVCHDMSIRQLARQMGEGGGAGQERTRALVLGAVDQLVTIFGLVARPAAARVRGAGERAADWSVKGDGEAVDDSGQ